MLAGVLALAGAGWLVLGLPLSAPAELAALEAASWPTAPGKAAIAAASANGSGLALFAVATGPNATPELKLALNGLARDPHGAAALIAVGDGPPGWLSLGQTRDGATLVGVEADKATVDTALGFREVELGKTSMPPTIPGQVGGRP